VGGRSELSEKVGYVSEITVHYCSNPGGHAPKDCPDLKPDEVMISMYKCAQCEKEMNPAEFMLGPVCGECVRKNHEAAVRNGN